MECVGGPLVSWLKKPMFFFFQFKGNDGLNWKELLKIKSAHKLLYALEIIEALGKPNRRIRRESTVIVFPLLSLSVYIISGAKFQCVLPFYGNIFLLPPSINIFFFCHIPTGKLQWSLSRFRWFKWGSSGK